MDLFGDVRKKPYNTRIFDLPMTHKLKLNGSFSQEDLDFVIWCLSFFTGMRLTTTQNSFLDATPIKPRTLVDFCVSGSTELDAIQVALNYLSKENLRPLECRRIAAVIHVLFLAQSPQNLSFEKFQYLYMALDGCFAILLDRLDKTEKPKKPIHSGRVRWMCERLGIQPPSWADGVDNIANIRNDNFHEAIFFGKPLGFAVFGTVCSCSKHNIPLQMIALICRFLVVILGVKDTNYISSSIDTREIHQLKLR